MGPAFASSFEPIAAEPDRPGVVSWLSEDCVRNMLTALASFFGVKYTDSFFCALALVEGAGDKVCCTGVIGRSCVDSARGRLEGTANDASSSTRGRFSRGLVVVGVGLVLTVVLTLGMGVVVGVAVSPRRAAFFGMGFFLMIGPSVLGGASAGASFKIS